jgi:hypothetical protein
VIVYVTVFTGVFVGVLVYEYVGDTGAVALAVLNGVFVAVFPGVLVRVTV